jgi:Carbohydrate binding domain
MSPTSGPRHLAGPRASAPMVRNRAIGVVVGVLLLVGLAVAVSRVVGALGSRSDRDAGRAAATTVATPPTSSPAGSAVAPSSTTPTVTTVPGNLVANPGFETGMDGWRPIGAASLDRVSVAHQGTWATRLTGGSESDPGVTYPSVTTTKAAGSMYQASAWVRASQPGQTGEIRVLEYVDGERFAIFRSGLVLGDTGWHRLAVAQLVHVKGSTLGVEVVAPKLPANATLTVDDVTVRLATTK